MKDEDIWLHTPKEVEDFVNQICDPEYTSDEIVIIYFESFMKKLKDMHKISRNMIVGTIFDNYLNYAIKCAYLEGKGDVFVEGYKKGIDHGYERVKSEVLK